MKTSIKTIVIFIIITLITAGFTLARTSSSTTASTGISPGPARIEGDSNDAYINRMRTGEAEVRSIAVPPKPQTGTNVSGIPERPVKQPSETDAAFNARLRAWETEVRKIASTQSEAERLKQVLETLKGSYGAGAYGVPFVGAATVSDTSLVIPIEEMKNEDILAINEDMNVMYRILINDLNQEISNTSKIEWLFSDGRWTPVYGSYNSILGQSINTLNSIYLQGYGTLFMTNVNFLLSAPPDVNEEKDQVSNDDTDLVWQQTRQQIYQPQAAGTSRRISTAGATATEVRYDAQKVENLKTTLIQSLKHASNIRALKADESVILSITGSGGPSSTSFRANEDGRTLSEVRVLGARPTVLTIRAKKADIDAFAKSEINLEQFRQRVQIISYPLLQNNLPSATTGRTAGTRRTDTETSSTSRRGTNTTAVVPAQPVYETNN